MNPIWALLLWFRGLCLSRAALATENLALRQQLSTLRRQSPRPQLNDRDRLYWICMKMLRSSWREALQIVTPETVVRWHRDGFRYYWRWKSRPKGGRKKIDQEIRELIRRMARENSTWVHPGFIRSWRCLDIPWQILRLPSTCLRRDVVHRSAGIHFFVHIFVKQ